MTYAYVGGVISHHGWSERRNARDQSEWPDIRGDVDVECRQPGPGDVRQDVFCDFLHFKET